MNHRRRPYLTIAASCLFLFLVIAPALHALGQAAPGTIASASGAVETAAEDAASGMTLFDLLKAGGWVMAVIGALSILTLALAVYYLFIFTEKQLAPPALVSQIRNYARERKLDEIARLCSRSNAMLAKVIAAGAAHAASSPEHASEAMETVGRREAESMMRKARYLSDIATIAPMLGLLGTVLGMIQAFNFIAFDISAVKPVALASAVAQALVTTAAGLIVAIPSMGLFFFFRGKLEGLVARVEEIAVETADLIAHSPQKTTTRKTVRKAPSAAKPAPRA